MVRLDDLSTELILDILGRIPPEDLESTTLISKTVYPIARTLLDQHREVLAQQYEDWNDIVTIKETHPLHRCTHLHASLLCTIFTDRRLARMVQTLTHLNFGLRSMADYEIHPEKAWRPDDLFPGSLPGLRKSQRLAENGSRTRIQILEEAVCQCSLITPSQRGLWLKKLHRGSEEFATALLLWHLPALRCLNLALGSTKWPELYASLLQFVEHAATISAPPTPAFIPAELPLQDLERLYIVFREARDEYVALVRAFLSLPRLLSLNCSSLSVRSVRKTTPMRKLAKASAMNSLVFQNCILDTAGLIRLLEGVNSVTCFSYDWSGTKISDAYEWVKFGPPAVVGALTGSVNHKLEELRPPCSAFSSSAADRCFYALS